MAPRRHPRIVVRSCADLPWIFCTGGHGSSVRIPVENGGDHKANFVRNNAEGAESHRKVVRIIIVGVGLPLIFPHPTLR